MKLEGKTPEEQEMIQAATEILRQEARDEVREEVATNMLRRGIEPDAVAEMAHLSQNTVQRLQREINEA